LGQLTWIIKSGEEIDIIHMNNEVERIPVLKFTGESVKAVEDFVVQEFPLIIYLNGEELVTLLCSPSDLKYLAVGYLFSEGLISGKDDVKSILTDDIQGVVRIETAKGKTNNRRLKRYIGSSSGSGISLSKYSKISGLTEIKSPLTMTVLDIISLNNEFQNRSEVFRATGGVHSAALCDPRHIFVFSEDVGRHNAVDKVFGKCLLENLSTEDRIIATSCRISSEILIKVARRNIPILITKSAPTNLGVKLAKEFGITLIGFVRGQNMNVYSNEWRLINA
jgi:FdhD protein